MSLPGCGSSGFCLSGLCPSKLWVLLVVYTVKMADFQKMMLISKSFQAEQFRPESYLHLESCQNWTLVFFWSLTNSDQFTPLNF